MKLFGLDIKRARPRKATSAYPSAIISRLNEDFPIHILSADGATRWNLTALRARSQQLEREKGGIAERYLSCVETNVIGSCGIGLQMKVMPAGAMSDDEGEYDMTASEAVEEAWEDFCCGGQFEVTGEHDCQNFDRISVRSSARDGDVLQLIYRGLGEYGVQFQLLEGQYLDEQHNVGKLPNGNAIRMGVELDRFKRKVAFWILSKHPGDYGIDGYGDGAVVYDGRRVRVPVFDPSVYQPVQAIHVTRTKRPEETRAVPWITPAMDSINMLAGYEEAELVAARAQACKHIFFERTGFAPDGQPLDYGEGASGGQLTDETEPGGSTELPIGYKANFYNPTHPTMAFPDFTKDFRRKIASALNCAYNTLFNDLEGVNFSSIRAGLLDEREQWKMTQNWYLAASKQKQFEAWLQTQLIMGNIPGLGLTDFKRIARATVWKCKRWPWVDPEKDITASRLAIEAKLSTRSREIADHYGCDFEDTIDEIAHEQEYIRSKKLDPFIAEPKRAEEVIDQADQPNSPDANTSTAQATADAAATAQPMQPQHHSARQPRQGGRFAGPPAPAKAEDSREQVATNTPLYQAPIHVTVNIPETKSAAPIVNNTYEIKVPEQAAPIVNVEAPATPEIKVQALPAPVVNVNVEPTPVNIQNNVTVPTAQSMRVQRDGQGRMTSVEIERQQ